MTNKEYQNYISLGYFCGIAEDLEKIGLRSFSSPFDWILSSFPKVILALEKEFDNFLSYSNLSQSVELRDHYHDDYYDCYFFHDFDKYKSLKKQYQSVYDKYNRRISRFLSQIRKPTLFFYDI